MTYPRGSQKPTAPEEPLPPEGVPF